MELTRVQRTRWLTTHAYDLTPLQGLSLYMCTPPVSNPWYPQRTSHSILTWQEIELIPIENNCLIIEPLIHSGYECQCSNVCIYAIMHQTHQKIENLNLKKNNPLVGLDPCTSGVLTCCTTNWATLPDENTWNVWSMNTKTLWTAW